MHGSASGHGTGPVFVSRSASQVPKQVGIVSRIRAGLFRSSRRRESKREPMAAKSRVRMALILTVLLAGVVVLAFVSYAPLLDRVSRMHLFRIQEITITGCRMTSPAQIRELAGVRYQDSMLALNTGHIAAILKAHPWVAQAEVKRGWPDTLVIGVKEYVAEALIVKEVSNNRQLFYLDKSGVAFAHVEPGHDMDLPVITGLEGKDGENQGGLSGLIDEPLALLKLVRQNNPNLPFQNLSEIHIDKDTGMTIYLVDYPFPIYFGKGEIRTKFSLLKRTLEALYKGTEQGLAIADIAYIRMDYLENKNKVLLGTQRIGLKGDG
jgi:cell division protein FtsQ